MLRAGGHHDQAALCEQVFVVEHVVLADDADQVGHAVVAEDFVVGGDQDGARVEDVAEVDRGRLSIGAVLDAQKDLVPALLAYFGIAKDAVHNPEGRGDRVGDVVEDGAQEHARGVLFGDVVCNAVLREGSDVGRALLITTRGVVLCEAVNKRLAALDGSFEEDVLGEDVQHDVYECRMIIAKHTGNQETVYDYLSTCGWEGTLTARPSGSQHLAWDSPAHTLLPS